jgi:hypothetical protein
VLCRENHKTERVLRDVSDRSISRRRLSPALLTQDFDQLLAGLVSRVQDLTLVLQDKELSEHQMLVKFRSQLNRIDKCFLTPLCQTKEYQDAVHQTDAKRLSVLLNGSRTGSALNHEYQQSAQSFLSLYKPHLHGSFKEESPRKANKNYIYIENSSGKKPEGKASPKSLSRAASLQSSAVKEVEQEL